MTATQLSGPLLLFLMMVVVGMELTPADFRRVAAYPRAVVVGTLGQVTLLPLGAAVLVWLLDLPPHIAAGVVIVTAAPGGGISNLFCYVAGANAALSVTLTAVGSLLAVVSLPVIVSLGFQLFLGEHSSVEVPVAVMIGQLVLFVLLPIGLGMALRRRRPQLVARHVGRLRQIAMAAVGILIVASMAFGPTPEQADLVGDMLRGLYLGLLWTVLAMTIGFTLGRIIGLTSPDAFTLLIEFSVKNGAMAAIVAISALGRPDFAVFLGSYIFVGYPLAYLLCALHRRRWVPVKPPA